MCDGVARERKGEPEATATSRTALYADLPTHRLGQAPRDREPEPGSFACPLTGYLDALEGLEQGQEVLGRDTDTGVLDAQERHVLTAFEAHLYATGVRELERVRDEVAEHLTHALHVGGGHDLAAVGFDLQLDGAVARHLAVGSQLVVEIAGQVHRGRLERNRAGLDLRDVEKVADQGQQLAARRENDAELLALLGGHGSGHAGEDQIGETDDRVERRAKLVRHRTQKYALHAIRGLRPIPGDDELSSPLEDAVLQLHVEAAQTRLTFPQRACRANAVRHVDQHAEYAVDLVVAVAQRRERHVDVRDRPVEPPARHFDAAHGLPGERPLTQPLRGLGRRMHHGRWMADGITRRHAGELLRGVIPHRPDAPVGVEVEDRRRGGRDQRSPSVVERANLVGSLARFGDVGGGASNGIDVPRGVPYGKEGDQHGAFAADRNLLLHRNRLPGLDHLAITRRDRRRILATEELLAFPAKQLLERGLKPLGAALVREQAPSLDIGQPDGGGACVDDGP